MSEHRERLKEQDIDETMTDDAESPDAAADDVTHAGYQAGDDEAAIEAADPEVTEPPAAVRLHHVSRWYGDVIGVNDVDVRVEPGIIGILGPNGAGKSTLIKMLVGLMRPSTGRVLVLGEDPWNNPDVLGRIGYVPEAPAPWRDANGLDAVTRAARLSGMSESDARSAATQALERVGLTDVADRPVGTYSHGMQQRLKFALATVHEPELLVLDEPLLGTDPIARRDLLDLIRELGRSGVSILLSTHVLPDVEALTDRILVMNHGRLMAYGDVNEIRDLLERYPRTIRIGSPDPRTLGQAVWGWPSVLSLESSTDTLTVRTKQPAEFYAALQDLLANGEHAFTFVTSPDDHVESVFRYLVG